MNSILLLVVCFMIWMAIVGPIITNGNQFYINTCTCKVDFNLFSVGILANPIDPIELTENEAPYRSCASNIFCFGNCPLKGCACVCGICRPTYYPSRPTIICNI